jgi:phage terminase large subunit
VSLTPSDVAPHMTPEEKLRARDHVIGLLGRIGPQGERTVELAENAPKLLEPFDRIARWRDDPVVFAEEAFGLRVWSRQQEVLRAVRDHERVAVRGGRKISKTLNIAVIAYWWMVRELPDSNVIIMSASGRQISHFIWPEIKKLWGLAIRTAPSKESFRLSNEPNTLPDTGVEFPNGKIIGFSTDEQEKAQGASGVNTLYILDEATGIEEIIHEAIEGNLAGGGRIIMFANPTRTTGTFFDAFDGDSDLWHPIHISSEESPNVTGKEPPIPGLATRDWIEARKRKWGEHSPRYRIHVKGEFPDGSTDTVVPPNLLKASFDRWSPAAWENAEGPLVLGVDVARKGDDNSVVTPVRGLIMGAPRIVHGFDNVEVAELVARAVRDLRRPGEIVSVRVDAIGVGAGVFDILNRLDGLDVIEVQAGGKPADDDYGNVRDELWFGIRAFVERGGALHPSDNLREELGAVCYRVDQRTGKVRVEGKDDLKARLDRSPDESDALALAVLRADAVPAATVIASLPMADAFRAPNSLSREFPQWGGRSFGSWGAGAPQRGFRMRADEP